MYLCQYDLRSGGRGCQKEKAFDYLFCPEHLDTPRGRAHVMEVIQSRQLVKPSDIQAAIDKAKELPEADYHTSALEQMANTLTVIQDWVDETRQQLDSLPKEQWRYKDRAQQEQVRTEVVLYERALDRVSRHLGAMSKVSLHDKIVSLGKAQVDMMIRMIMTVVSELQLRDDVATKANAILLDLFEREANLTARVEHHAQKQLASAPPPMTVDEQMVPQYAEKR